MKNMLNLRFPSRYQQAYPAIGSTTTDRAPASKTPARTENTAFQASRIWKLEEQRLNRRAMYFSS
ncbi:hypothetical protein [Undibacterium sp. TJN19]|uniref:hypothetical protein n=1 Tax=Undibacterium sp. TJN19 TaxID=3413055 RepID=UPI003BF1E7F2